MTNLTDEGLKLLSRQLLVGFDLGTWESKDELTNDIFSTLQQVRDAAKKEMKERAAKVAEDTCLLCGQKNVSAQVEGQDRGCTAMSKPHLTSQLGATAIRQMEGGK